MVLRTLRELLASGRAQVLVDVGCGGGDLAAHVRDLAGEYVGCDLIRYENFPEGQAARFVQCDLNGAIALGDACADCVVSIETIEHLENPRAFVRELARIAKPGAPIVLTTPNQLSLLSKLTLIVKGEFNAFQEAPGLYPSHITALVERDLLRIATECGLETPLIRYTDSGRIPFTSRHYPAWLWFRGRAFSDNVLLAARKPAAHPHG